MEVNNAELLRSHDLATLVHAIETANLQDTGKGGVAVQWHVAVVCSKESNMWPFQSVEMENAQQQSHRTDTKRDSATHKNAEEMRYALETWTLWLPSMAAAL